MVVYHDPVILYNEKDLCNELHASWAKISKLCMMDYEKAQKDNGQSSQFNGFQGFPSDSDSSIQYPDVLLHKWFVPQDANVKNYSTWRLCFCW